MRLTPLERWIQAIVFRNVPFASLIREEFLMFAIAFEVFPMKSSSNAVLVRSGVR